MRFSLVAIAGLTAFRAAAMVVPATEDALSNQIRSPIDPAVQPPVQAAKPAVEVPNAAPKPGEGDAAAPADHDPVGPVNPGHDPKPNEAAPPTGNKPGDSNAALKQGQKEDSLTNAKGTTAEPVEPWAKKDEGSTNVLRDVPLESSGGDKKIPIEKLEPGRPQKPISEVIDFGDNDGNDQQETMKGQGSYCTRGAVGKRDISIESSEPFKFPKRSPDDWAQPAPVWREFMNRVEAYLANDHRVTRQLDVYAFGGFASLMINGRGADGKTGDFDAVYHPGLTAPERSAIETAVVNAATDMAKKGYPNMYMDTTVSGPMAGAINDIVSRSTDIVRPGNILRVWNGAYGYQVVNKLDKVKNWAKDHQGNVRSKDRNDAVAFLKKAVAAKGGKIGMSDLTYYGYKLGVDATDAVMASGAAIHHEWNKGFAQDVRDLWRSTKMDTGSPGSAGGSSGSSSKNSKSPSPMRLDPPSGPAAKGQQLDSNGNPKWQDGSGYWYAQAPDGSTYYCQ